MPQVFFPCHPVKDDIEQVVENICARPGMYVFPPTFHTVCAYLDGFNAARDGGPLMGLNPWMVTRRRDGNNLHWIGLAELLIGTTSGEEHRINKEEHRINKLGQLLAEFFEYRRANGLEKIWHEYAKWLLSKSWYSGPLRKPRKPATDHISDS